MMDMSISSAAGATVTNAVSPLAQTRALRQAPPPEEAIEDDIETPSSPTAAPPLEKKSGIKWWSKENFSFKDILDILNPLQHLPVISTLYRAWTGEGIGGVARLVGGAIYGRAGGFLGMATSVVNAAIGVFTGKDIGERVYAAVFGDPKASETKALAHASAPVSPPRGSAGARLALSLAPIAQPGPAGVDTLTYRQIQPIDVGAADETEIAIDRKRPAAFSAAAKETTIFRGRITREVIDALDLYDRLAPLRAPQPKKTGSERTDDLPLASRRANRERFRE